MKVEYSSNNSGGSWWLKDKDWKNLEKAGWHVFWGGMYFCRSEYRLNEKPKDKPESCKSSKTCKGHRRFDSAKEAEKERWLGALAKDATKDFSSIKEAIEEFESITGQCVTDEGCNCCGSPHTFHWGKCATDKCSCKGVHKDYHYASGDDLSGILYGEAGKKTKRELLENVG